jgi:mRNA interferase RelE/StbE
MKRLTNYTLEYRLLVGDYRVLFEIEEDVLVIYRVKDRKDAYS